MVLNTIFDILRINANNFLDSEVNKYNKQKDKTPVVQDMMY